MFLKRQKKMYIMQELKGFDHKLSIRSCLSGVFCALILTLCVYSTFWCMVDGLFPYRMYFSVFISILIANVTLYVIYIMKLQNNMYARIAKIGSVVLIFLFGVTFLKSILEGIFVIINREIELINQYFSIHLRGLSSYLFEDMNNEYLIKVTVLFLGLLLSILFQHIYFHKMNSIIYLAITIPIVILPIVGGTLPGAVPLTLYCVSTLIYIGSKGFKFGNQNDEMQKQAMIILSIGFLAATIFICLLYPPKRYNKAALFHEGKQDFQEFLMEMTKKDFWANKEYVNRILGVSSTQTCDGDLSSAISVKFNGQTVLELMVSDRQTSDLYLKDFIGDYYDGKRWKTFSSVNTDEDYDIFKGMLVRNNINIEQIYNFISTENQPNDRHDILQIDPLINKEKILLPYATNNLYTIDNDGSVKLDFDTNRFIYWRDLNRYMTEYFEVMDGIHEGYLDENYIRNNYLNVDLEASSQLYQSVITHEFIYTYYTQIDDCPSMITDELIEEILNKYGDGVNSNLVAKVMAVRRYMTDTYHYTLSIENKPEDVDFVDNFMTTKEGYCVHYATTATLILRKMGVPARYVEGYLVDGGSLRERLTQEEDVPEKQLNNQTGLRYHTVEVEDNDGHAWVEVYVDGLGFIPAEMTYSNSFMPEHGFIEEEETATLTPTQTPKNEASVPDEKEEPPVTKMKISMSKVFGIVFIVLISLTAIASAVLISMRFYRKKRFHELEAMAIRSKRVLLLYNKLDIIFHSLGCEYLEGSREEFAMTVYQSILEMKHCRIPISSVLTKKEFAGGIDIAFKSFYSGSIINVSEEEQFVEFYYRVRSSLLSTTSLLEKIYYYFIIIL